jgi:hypothetical protein
MQLRLGIATVSVAPVGVSPTGAGIKDFHIWDELFRGADAFGPSSVAVLLRRVDGTPKAAGEDPRAPQSN